MSVEEAEETMAVSVRSLAKTSRENLAVRSQDVEKLAVAAAVVTLTVIVNLGVKHSGKYAKVLLLLFGVCLSACSVAFPVVKQAAPDGLLLLTLNKLASNQQAGSLTAPHSMVEEAITKAVVASSAQVGDTSTSSDYIFVLWYLAVTFCCGVALLALLVVRLSN